MAEIAIRGVEALSREFGSSPADIRAGIGPAIGPCCYQVGADVADAFGQIFVATDDVVLVESGRYRVDLPRANALVLARAGLRPENVESAGTCTACHADLFYSHRAEAGRAGRFAAVAGLMPR